MGNEYVYFQILEDMELPFKYVSLSDGTHQAQDDQPGIDTAEEMGIIKIIRRGIDQKYKKYIGGAEPIYDDGLKFVMPSDDGRDLEVKPFGDFRCVRCDRITHIEQNGDGKVIAPFECECKRQGPFKNEFPTELLKPIWKLPNKPIESNAWDTYNDVLQYVKDHLVLKDDEYYILSLWIMASWIHDEFDTSVYSLFIAPKASGKTQALNVINELGYRSFLTVSITPASIFRALDKWHILPLIDESEFQINTSMVSESASALYGIMNGGYKKGSMALRTEDNTRLPVAFNIFGFKACASTKIFLPTLESRSIIYHMTQGKPKNILIDQESSKMIRSKLLHFRFSSLGKTRVIMPKSQSGRIIELFMPLYSTLELIKAPDGIASKWYCDVKKILFEKIKSMESDREQEEQTSPEAQIIESIWNYKKLNVDSITAKSIALDVKWSDENDNKEFRKTVQKIGYHLKGLGIKIKHTNAGNLIDFNDKETSIRLDELKQRYIK